MTIQDLSKYYWLNKKVEKLKLRLNELESTLIGSSKITDVKVDSSKNTNSLVEQKTLLIIQLKNQLDNKIKESLKEEIKLEKFISNIDDIEIELIVRYRFKDGMTWGQIAHELSYDRTTPRKKLIKYLESLK